tara:strand:- start:491 stop:943 length:453 start_codon:yes stop_codon:yes gene_type:complete
VNRIVSFLFLVFTDLVIKYIIKKSLFVNQSIELNKFLDIVYVKNYGVSFGLFSGKISYVILVIIGLIISLIILYLMITSKKNIEKNAFFLILSGAFGNILDRAINSYVFDFISLNYGNFYWPAFNLADIYITVGIIMLITSIFINFDQKK